jgi:hypothetical protein
VFRRAAEIADKVLKGANPADVRSNSRPSSSFSSISKLRGLGFTVPPTLLARVDELTE